MTTAWENKEYDILSRFYTAFSRWYVVAVIPVVRGLAVVGPDLLCVISTPEIARNAAPVLPLLVVAVALKGLESPLTFVLTSQNGPASSPRLRRRAGTEPPSTSF